MIDHDRLFKELITTFFVEFIELFLPKMRAYLDPDSLVALDKELFSDLIEGERRETDVLMKARFKDKEAYFLIHLENQSYSEAEFPLRMFFYFASLYKKFRHEVYPIALFSYDTPMRPEPAQHKVEFPDIKVLNFKYTVIQLNRLKWQDFIERPNPIASALMAKMKIAPEDRVKVKLECLKMLVGLDLDPARTHLISGFVDTYLELNREEEHQFQKALEEIAPPKKEEMMQIVTSWMKEGIRQGELTLLLKQLSHRVGTLTPDLEARVQSLSEAQVNGLALALLDFSNIQDLEIWLANHPAEGEKE